MHLKVIWWHLDLSPDCVKLLQLQLQLLYQKFRSKMVKMSKQKSQLLSGEPATSPRLPQTASDVLRESYTYLGTIDDYSLVWSQAAWGCLRLPATNLGQSWMVTGLILAQSGTGREIVGDNLRLLQAAWD